jgi:hypothetical protein
MKATSSAVVLWVIAAGGVRKRPNLPADDLDVLKLHGLRLVTQPSRRADRFNRRRIGFLINVPIGGVE